MSPSFILKAIIKSTAEYWEYNYSNFIFMSCKKLMTFFDQL